MNGNSLTAKDFLAVVKSAKERPYAGTVISPEYSKVHREQERQSGAEGINPEIFFETYFRELFDRFTDVLSPEIKVQLVEQIAVGVMDHTVMNAFIMRNSDATRFAILFHRALLTMINHYVKLITAANYPESVIFCEGLQVGTLSRRDYVTMASAMVTSYGKTGKPVGPELKLETGSDALTRVGFMTGLIHQFVLAHELGHYLNGDLKMPEHFMKSDLVAEGMVFGNSISHAKEFKADIKGFELLLRVVSTDVPDFPAHRILQLSVVIFFNFLREISNRGSESHPAPSERIVAVTKEFFGNEAGEMMKQSFANLALVREFEKMVGNETVAELLRRRG